MAMTPPALHLDGVTKYFGGATALDNASLVVQPGTVHALLGENGAGKTTLMRVAFGMVRADVGTMSISGVRHHTHSPAQAIAAGIGMVHQHFMLVPAMTVAENVALGGRGRYQAEKARDYVRDLATRHHLPADPGAIVGTLPVSAQQRVEILKALAREAKILILDEPTAVLAPAESADLLNAMRAFAAKGGAVVLITHKLREALEFADEITVLRRGRNTLMARAGDVTTGDLAAAMIGTSMHANDTDGSDSVPNAAIQHADVLTLEDITVRDTRGLTRVDRVNVRVRSHEILGIVAVEGNGQHELLRVMSGRLAPTSGVVRLQTAPGTTRQPRIGFVPEDRHRDALILDFALHENIALRGASQKRGLIDWGHVQSMTRDIATTYDVRTAKLTAPARTLSGGNQQKLVIGRELQAVPAVLVAENPSRGLDVHATAAVHQHLRAARDAGAGVVMYSSDLDEVMALATRIVVMLGGRIIEVPSDRDIIGRAMLGQTTPNPS